MMSHILTDQLNIPKQLLIKYKQLGLNETDLAVILHIYRFQCDGNTLPTFLELSDYLAINDQICAQILRKLRQKGFLSIEQEVNEDKVINEKYSLDLLWEKLYTEESKEVTPTQEDETNLFILFEQEFGRPLTPFEIETVNLWLDEDNYLPSLIKAGLREAVLMGKLNFKYIDRILREWKKKGVKTVDQARQASQQFRKNNNGKATAGSQEKRDVSIYYNWLDEE